VGGHNNTATGSGPLFSNTSGNNNTAWGINLFFSTIDGDNNTASGYQSLITNTAGNQNTAIGSGADVPTIFGRCNCYRLNAKVNGNSLKVVIVIHSFTVIGGQVGWST